MTPALPYGSYCFCGLATCWRPLELAIVDAEDLLDDLAADEVPIDLVFADPPWALGRCQSGNPRTDGSERLYAASREGRMVGGYVDIEPDRYPDFTRRWIGAARRALEARPGAYLAVVTGPQQAARVQVEAEAAGLVFVSQVVAKKVFPLYSTRRPAFGHLVMTVTCSGPLTSRRRFFSASGTGQRSRSGQPSATTWWEDVGRPDRPGLLRYDNALPPALVRRTISMATKGPENGGGEWEALVVDPFTGGGETAVQCAALRRRFVGGDVNGAAVRFAAGRVLDEVVWPEEVQPRLALG